MLDLNFVYDIQNLGISAFKDRNMCVLKYEIFVVVT